MTHRNTPAGIDRWLDDGGPSPDRAMKHPTRQEDPMNFVIYSDNGGLFHWRLDADDGTPVAVSSGTFASADAARAVASDVHDGAGAADGAAS
jgi:uncharacterized protein YegP (UPF0339 family)